METKKYDRKTARGILTPKERAFLINFPSGRSLTSHERHYVSSITHKTRKALKDLDVIFEKLPDSHLLLSEEDMSSLKKPIEEITEILYHRNYPREFWRRRKIRREVDKRVLCEKTRNQINKIVNSTLNKLRAKPIRG